MSETLDELKEEATVGAEYFRDHELGEWVDAENRPSGVAVCKKCGMWVGAIENPQPNDIDIGGPAVAMTCPGVTACPECGEALHLDHAILTPTTSTKIRPWESRGADFFIIGTCHHCKETIEVGVNVADQPIKVPF